MKILYILNFASKVNSFSEASMLAAKEKGIDFCIAGSWGYRSDEERKIDELKYGIKIFQVDFHRNPINLKNIKAYYQIVEIIKNEKIDVIHCNTPIGGVVGRIAGLKCGIRKVIYQAHGFHFYSGGPKLNWLLFYPIERLLALHTDVLITINQEDYNMSKSFKLRQKGKRHYIPGIGIDTKKFSFEDKEEIRKKIRKDINIPNDAKMILSIGELNKNKNHLSVIHSMKEVKRESNIYYAIAGTGELQKFLQQTIIDLGLQERVFLLGYRNDISKLLSATDIYILPSFREGLNASLMEAMSSGIPCIVSNIRGNRDLIEDGHGGYVVDPTNLNEISSTIQKLFGDNEIRKKMGEYNLKKIKSYDISVVVELIKNIY
ncbi:glycosyltransferase family 4 protein [Enterococcus mundtii]|uniref:Glycosyltransferase family 1 protein n=1 Tax=Enterococcus mundtii TaxID=53346 RepID=A0A2S7RP58_ENTMU|nr:glycosyltransferase family 4 protein [Enterococcus mundtii]PQF21035.1 glycosyltransferase family 1 protein [Enterococcus mundtii]